MSCWPALVFCALLGAAGATLDPYAGLKPVCKSIRWYGGEPIQWPCETTKELFKSGKKYIGKNMLATRVAVHKDEAFLALPRFKCGVPFTLAKVDLKSKKCQANLTPFPSWSSQEEGTCTALQSIVDLFLDSEDILWALDTGIVNVLEEPMRRCPAKLAAVNARTGKLVKRVDLSPLVSNSSRLQYVVAERADNGHVFAYVSDAASRAILVYDVTSERGYRAILPGEVSRGCARRDVLTLALLRRPEGDNSLLFSYFSGRGLFSVRTSFLQRGLASAQIQDLGPKTGRIVLLGTDGGTNVFFRNEGEADVYRWNLDDCPAESEVEKVYEGRQCQLPTHVVQDGKRGRMRVLESNFPDYFQGTVGCGATHALNVF